MFTQLFKLPFAGESPVPVTWSEPRDGFIRVIEVDGRPASELPLDQYLYVDRACGQRMAERGEHGKEP
jgi:hypothetical protein